MPTYNFSDAIKVVGLNSNSEKSELNAKKKEFEVKFQAFLDTYRIVGDKSFSLTFVPYEDKRYSESSNSW